MNKNVLISGGTGLIGTRLNDLLRQKGYQVSLLSRTKGTGETRKYQWDLQKMTLEEEAIQKADYIVNLAGANLFDHKWTKSFKKEIIESRTQSVHLIGEKLKTVPHSVKAFISASAIGYYGADTGDKEISESTAAGNDFLSEVVQKWEASVEEVAALNIRTVKLRIGIVLASDGGALKELMAPIRKGAGAVLASGKQYISWIHIDDVCNLIIEAIENEKWKGVYNAVAPNPVTNEELTKEGAKKINKSIVLPHVPEFVLKMMLGSERAGVLIGGNKVFPHKVIQEGYSFKFPTLDKALEDLLS